MRATVFRHAQNTRLHSCRKSSYASDSIKSPPASTPPTQSRTYHIWFNIASTVGKGFLSHSVDYASATKSIACQLQPKGFAEIIFAEEAVELKKCSRALMLSQSLNLSALVSLTYQKLCDDPLDANAEIRMTFFKTFQASDRSLA